MAVQYRELLQLVMHVLNKPTMEAKQNLPTVSRKIAQCVTVLAQTAELLKGADWVDPDDPMLIAENELLGAAQSIEKAARKLASLKPRREQGASNVSNPLPFLMTIQKTCSSATSCSSRVHCLILWKPWQPPADMFDILGCDWPTGIQTYILATAQNPCVPRKHSTLCFVSANFFRLSPLQSLF